MARVAGFYFVARAKPTKKAPGQKAGAYQGVMSLRTPLRGHAGQTVYWRASTFPARFALYPATSEREKISVNQLNKETGNRTRYRNFDAETGEGVEQPPRRA